MRRVILLGVLAFFSCIAAIFVVAVGVGELLSGAAPTAVNTLSTDFPVEPVQIPVSTLAREENSSVHGWLARGVRGGGAVLLVHSIRSNRVEMLSRAKFLNERGYNVLLIDLQAHGETPGDRITFGLRESEDVEAAVAYLRNTFPGERIAAIGVSLGAAAIVLAKNPLRLDAVVLESLHPTIEEAVENRLRLHLGQLGPVFSPLLLSQLSFRLDASPDELNPISRIGDLNAPLLLISGTDDRHTTVAEAERLFDAAGQPKEIWIVPGGGHFNMHAYAGKEYENRISDFLQWYLRKRD
ncbi:Alpha/beta hydrolase family protein [Nitrosospira sp. Nsp11]|uniref:alpha/beta hydrolase n=1 Tax=Nitrosospira sp. Nsp11 TaxID=1855338 RepID=UPI00091F4AF4|nr:alpha/beta fold hydrolase [Nitrosospira sp. Nsp11]SHL71870.1 Alpha/beta hydrolase family protein [Nitrosospira sp. Nsp11]